jgi:hypothetical protein
MPERNAHVHPIFRNLLNDITSAASVGPAQTLPQGLAQLRHRRPKGLCTYCDAHGDESMMPSHDASSACESGKRPHCTCDACF